MELPYDLGLTKTYENTLCSKKTTSGQNSHQVMKPFSDHQIDFPKSSIRECLANQRICHYLGTSLVSPAPKGPTACVARQTDSSESCHGERVVASMCMY
jgi:hypothetical protein